MKSNILRLSVIALLLSQTEGIVIDKSVKNKNKDDDGYDITEGT